MSTDPRLFLDCPFAPAAHLALSREDTHYVLNVMRRGEGDSVRLFNGRDGEWSARISNAHRKGATLALIAQTRPQASVPDLWLLFAPVKRQKTDLIVEKATELGVREIHPVSTRRSQADRIKPERFHIIAKEAAEQTERLDLPLIAPLARLERVLEGWDPARTLYYCDEAGDGDEDGTAWGGQEGRARPMLDVLNAGEAGPAALLIGPEGGFSPEERTQLRQLDFVRAVSLGPRILRAETAVIAALSLWQASLGDWG
ncbi:16S rRNA (uracil(1498)-N(3))-methyltransferase [uncultured Maricaulis sp.]|uniref:16S rRNA (uracil(1498)-N(3))-methyltransferase n=1 Tax=uncultured Maricaulis sp. TaxID=174710 RepID=UPI0030D8FA4F|tara:strand:+ start:11731 stop:12501 length:771 start_codon:yes stop_codon:yes gene_type:complete